MCDTGFEWSGFINAKIIFRMDKLNGSASDVCRALTSWRTGCREIVHRARKTGIIVSSNSQLILDARMQVGDRENAFGWRDVARNHSPLRSGVGFAFDDKVRNTTTTIAPRVQPASDARRIIGYHLRVFRLNGRIAIGVRIDNVAWETGADFIVSRDVQLVFGAAPQIA